MIKKKILIVIANYYKNISSSLLNSATKRLTKSFKVKVIETLWKIIYSNKKVDMYESNLMRRLCGLLYLDNKLAGEIKERAKKDFLK